MEKFDEWAAGYLEGTLSMEELSELARLVESDEALRRRFLELTGMEGLLRARFAPSKVEEDLLRRISVCLVGKEQEDRTTAEVLQRIERPAAPSRLRAARMARRGRWSSGRPAGWAWGLAAAAAIVIGGAAFFALRPPRPAPVPPAVRAPDEKPIPQVVPEPPGPRTPERPRVETPPPAPVPKTPSAPVAPEPVPVPPSPPPPESTPPPPPRPTVTAIARIANVQGEAFVLGVGGRAAARAGQDLLPGEGIESSNEVAVEYPDGTRLELGERTIAREFLDREGKSLLVARGTVRGRVSRQAEGRPMVLRSPHAEAAVIGTSLLMAVDTESTKLDVMEGRVRLKRLSDGKSLEVSTGQYAVVAAGADFAAMTRQAVTAFTLIDADADRPLAGFDPIKDGAVINLARLPSRNLNIRANTVPPSVGCVQFALDGNAEFNTEREAPYALVTSPGQGDFAGWTPAVGWHTLSATPYSGPPGPGKRRGTGVAGTTLTIRFQVIDKK